MTWGKVVSMEEKWFSYPLSASQRWEGWNKEKKGGMEKKSNRPGFLHMPLGLFYFTTFRWVYFIIHLRDPLLPSIYTYAHSGPPSPSSQSQRRNPAYSRPPSQHPTRKHPRPSTPPHRQHPPHPSWPSQSCCYPRPSIPTPYGTSLHAAVNTNPHIQLQISIQSYGLPPPPDHSIITSQSP